MSISALSALLSLTAACSARATPAQCKEMLDRYLDLAMPTETNADAVDAERESRKTERRSTPPYDRASTRCTSEVTQKEFRCAMAASNMNAWEACID